MKALLDTNVVLDVLLDRKPYSEDSAEVFRLIEQGRVQGLLCATTMTTIDYLLTQGMKRNEARRLLAQMLAMFDVAPVNRAVLEAALNSGIDDFEDAVLDHAALLTGADVIVTRNSKDFARSRSRVMDPRQFVALLSS